MVCFKSRDFIQQIRVHHFSIAMLKHVYAENMYMQRTLNYFVSGSITVRQISCLTSLDSAALRMFNQQQIYLFV